MFALTRVVKDLIASPGRSSSSSSSSERGAGLRALARVAHSPLQWRKQAGPFFGNELGELVLDGRDARFLLWATSRDEDLTPHFTQVLDTRLS